MVDKATKQTNKQSYGDSIVVDTIDFESLQNDTRRGWWRLFADGTLDGTVGSSNGCWCLFADGTLDATFGISHGWWRAVVIVEVHFGCVCFGSTNSLVDVFKLTLVISFSDR